MPPSQSGHTVSVIAFENDTQEPILGSQVTSAFKETLIRRGVFVSNPDKAMFTLSGKVNQLGQVLLALNSNGQASASRVTIGVEHTVSEKTNLVKFNASASADYFNSQDSDQDRTAKDRAMREASFRLAEKMADDVADFITNGMTPPAE